MTLEVIGAEDGGALGVLEERWQREAVKPPVLIKDNHFISVVVNSVALVGVCDGNVKTQVVIELIGSDVELGEFSGGHIELKLMWTVHKP